MAHDADTLANKGSRPQFGSIKAVIGRIFSRDRYQPLAGPIHKVSSPQYTSKWPRLQHTMLPIMPAKWLHLISSRFATPSVVAYIDG